MYANNYVDFRAAMARQNQPTIKHPPPIGVIAPSHPMPLRLNIYRLPEKMMMPAMKAQPAVIVHMLGQ